MNTSSSQRSIYPRAATPFLVVFAWFAVLSTSVRADVVTDWNIIATTTAPAGGKNAVEQSRIYAMTHAAIHDALNAIDRRNRPYAFDQRAMSSASLEAAVAAAARDVLVAQLPTQRAALDAVYAASLEGIADGPAKTSGIAIGQAAAAAILALRSADGSTAPMPYTPGTEPGSLAANASDFCASGLAGMGQCHALRANERLAVPTLPADAVRFEQHRVRRRL